jgi:hypothetical protein
MTFKVHQSKVRTLKPGDRNFLIVDDLVTVQRAAFEISENCPPEYKSIIKRCIGNSWLTPIAHVHERELLFMGLSRE